MKRILCTILLSTLLLASCTGDTSGAQDSDTDEAGADTPADTVTETEPETEPEPVVIIPQLPFYEKGDLNSEVLPALFEGKATYEDVTTGIGTSFGMHFGDFLKVGDEIWCYYIKWNNGLGGVGLAKSTDGVNFEDYGFVLEAAEGNGWDNKMSTFPGIWYEDGIYYLVYEGSGTDNRGAVALATSTDGISFEKKGIIVDYTHKGTGLDGANTGTPDLFKVDGTWYVTYHSFNWTDCQICVAYGEDLMNLTKYEGNPVIPTSRNKAEPDSGTTGRRDILYYDGWYYMVYEISTDQPYASAEWGHAFARSTDMLTWETIGQIYPSTESGFGNDGPAWLVLDGEVYVYFRSGGTVRYHLVMS